MSEMVQRVAKVLEYECYTYLDPEERARLGRLIIAAMREPTDDMRYAIPPRVGGKLPWRDIGDTWKRMVDAALGHQL